MVVFGVVLLSTLHMKRHHENATKFCIFFSSSSDLHFFPNELIAGAGVYWYTSFDIIKCFCTL